jgi:hypothetical protein
LRRAPQAPKEDSLLQETETKRGFGPALLVSAVIVLVLASGLFWLSQRQSSEAASEEQPLPFGPVEQAYSERIHFLDLKMSRATNFLSQEFTFLYGVVSNDGNRTIRRMEVTVEFRDQLEQVVLRNTYRILGAKAEPLNGGFRRDFEFTFEHVPNDWNRQYPSIRVTGLVLED